MRRCSLAVVALTLLAPLLLVAEPASAATRSSSCTDGGGHPWTASLVWGSVYADAGVAKVSVKKLRFTTKASRTRYVDYVLTVADGNGTTIATSRRDDRSFSFDKGRRSISVDPRNPPSAPGQTTVVLDVGDGKDGKTNCRMTFVQPGTQPTPPTAPAGSWPSAPPAKVCGNAALLDGPATTPAGAVVVPRGDNSGLDLNRQRTTYWFAPGTHTLGRGRYDQITPGDSSTYLGGPGAVLDGQGKNAYAFTGDATGVTISYLTVKNFVAPMNEGTVNHDSGAGWTVSHSTISGNGGAGLFLGAHNRASYNCLAGNSQYGFQVYGEEQVVDVVLDHDEITGNNTGDWEKKVEGCGCTGGGKLWAAREVAVTNSYVHDNASVGLWADTNNDDVLFEGNWISDNAGQAIFYEISYNAAIRNNVIRHNLVADGRSRMKSGDAFPDAAIYLSESGGDARLPHGLVGSATIEIAGNLVEDNYNGVTLWENADRFCGSPANTSSSDCTLVNPSKANLKTCTKANIAKEPYFSDCRWKTQDVHVHHNTFTLDRSHFFGCLPTLCGRNAVFSNYGTFPSWSPYKGHAVAQAVTFTQGNVFSDNTYVGGWHVTAVDSGSLLVPAVWQAAPYRQDARSTFR